MVPTPPFFENKATPRKPIFSELSPKIIGKGKGIFSLPHHFGDFGEGYVPLYRGGLHTMFKVDF